MAAMLLEVLSELGGQHRFFFPCLDPIAEDDQANSGDASPAVNRQRSADCGQIDSGINGMPEISVGPAADELVVFFQSDSGAPILSQVPARPQSDGDADPSEGNTRNGQCVGAEKNVMIENAHLPFIAVAEEQDKAEDFQKEDAVTRGEGFLADGAARLHCAH